VPYNPYWVEEPVHPEAHDDYEAVAANTEIPLAGGESEPSPEGLRLLADTDAIRFLQADVRHHGGFTGCWDVATYCANRPIRFVPHNFGTHLGLVANAHLIAAVPEAKLLEYPVFGNDLASMYPFDLAADILSTDIDISDGRLQVPTGPGLGVEINFDVLDEYSYIEGPWTEFEYQNGRE
jgi:L-alanine-DL-glutamate epimerase-like enolase superfamily enzyme